MSESQPNILILAVGDLARASAFYAGGFGWTRTVNAPTYVELEISSQLRLGLYERAGFARNIGREPAPIAAGAIGPAELYLRRADIAAVIERLTNAGAELLSPLAPRDWGDDAAYFRDPDGHVVAVGCPSKAAG